MKRIDPFASTLPRRIALAGVLLLLCCAGVASAAEDPFRAGKPEDPFRAGKPAAKPPAAKDAPPGKEAAPGPDAPPGKEPGAAVKPGREAAPPPEKTAPLLEQEPFDRITLVEAQGGAVLTVLPLELPGRKLPGNPDAHDKLGLRLLDAPEKAYELEWQHIAKVELYEQLVLAEALGLMKAGKFDAAFDDFRYLKQKHPKLPGLDKAYTDFLLAEAAAEAKQNRPDAALALLREVYQRDSKRPELATAIPAITQQLIQHHAQAENYLAARRLLRGLAAWFPEDPSIAKWETQWKQQAQQLLGKARAALAAGKVREADETLRRVTDVWPQLEGAQQLAQQVHQKYPRLIVAVSELPALAAPDRFDDWSARRTARLVARGLTEFTGPGPQGGRYDAPLGEMEVKLPDRRLAVKLRPDFRCSSGTGGLTGYDAARALALLADPNDPGYRADWAALLGEITVQNIYRIDVVLRRWHPRPEAFMQVAVLPVTDPSVPDLALVSTGPYVIDQRDEKQTCFVQNSQQPGRDARQPKELVERQFVDMQAALTALQQGRVKVVDRVPPADVKSLKDSPAVKIEQYAWPLIHCLIPNMHKPLLQHRAFRRALVYGINREAVLAQLCGGQPLPGAQVLSGPFPRGQAGEESQNYAYDETIQPRPYDPRLALMLAQEAWRETGGTAAADGTAPLPALVLAHTASPTARSACGIIRSQFQLWGLNLMLRELPPGVPARAVGDVDLVYAELAVCEPAVDARRILGDDGLCGGCTPYMSLALRAVEQAADWPAVRNAVRQVHRVAHSDAAVVPLWQLPEFCAYHQSLQGVGQRPRSLYDNVQQWQYSFFYPAE